MARRSHLKAEVFKRVGLARAKPTVAAGDRTPPISSHDSRTFGRPDEARESVATASVQREAVHETRLDEGNEAADGDEEGPLVDDEAVGVGQLTKRMLEYFTPRAEISSSHLDGWADVVQKSTHYRASSELSSDVASSACTAPVRLPKRAADFRRRKAHSSTHSAAPSTVASSSGVSVSSTSSQHHPAPTKPTTVPLVKHTKTTGLRAQAQSVRGQPDCGPPASLVGPVHAQICAGDLNRVVRRLSRPTKSSQARADSSQRRQLARRLTAEELPPPPPPPNPRKASVGHAFRGASHDAAFEGEPPRRRQARAAEARVAPSSTAAPLWKLKLYGLHKRQPLLRQVDLQPTTDVRVASSRQPLPSAAAAAAAASRNKPLAAVGRTAAAAPLGLNAYGRRLAPTAKPPTRPIPSHPPENHTYPDQRVRRGLTMHALSAPLSAAVPLSAPTTARSSPIVHQPQTTVVNRIMSPSRPYTAASSSHDSPSLSRSSRHSPAKSTPERDRRAAALKRDLSTLEQRLVFGRRPAEMPQSVALQRALASSEVSEALHGRAPHRLHKLLMALPADKPARWGNARRWAAALTALAVTSELLLGGDRDVASNIARRSSAHGNGAIGATNATPLHREELLRWLDEVGMGELVTTVARQGGLLLLWSARQAAELLLRALRGGVTVALETGRQCVALSALLLRQTATSAGALAHVCETIVTSGVRLVYVYMNHYWLEFLDYTGLGPSKELRVRVLATLVLAAALWRGLDRLVLPATRWLADRRQRAVLRAGLQTHESLITEKRHALITNRVEGHLHENRHRGGMSPIQESPPKLSGSPSRLLAQGVAKPWPAPTDDPTALLIELASRLFWLDSQLRTRTLMSHDEMKAEVKVTVGALERLTVSWEKVFAMVQPTQGRPWEEEGLRVFPVNWALVHAHLGSTHPAVAALLSNCGVLMLLAECWVPAEKLLKRAVELFKRLHGGNSQEVADCIEGLYLLAARQEKLAAALTLNTHVLQWREWLLSESGQLHPRLPVANFNQAVLGALTGQYAEAVMRFERAIALWDQYGAGIHTYKLEAALCKLGCLHLSRGQYAEAEERLQRVRTMSAAQRGLNPWRVESHYALAIVRCRQQRPDDARKLYKSGLQLERSLPEVASDVRDRREQLVRELQLIAPSTSPRKVLDLVNEFPITCVVQ